MEIFTDHIKLYDSIFQDIASLSKLWDIPIYPASKYMIPSGNDCYLLKMVSICDLPIKDGDFAVRKL